MYERFIIHPPGCSGQHPAGGERRGSVGFLQKPYRRAKEELATQVAEARKERYLTKEQVKELCDVCDATLWHWNRKGYLKAVKVGNKVRYRTSDIQRILGERDGK